MADSRYASQLKRLGLRRTTSVLSETTRVQVVLSGHPAIEMRRECYFSAKIGRFEYTIAFDETGQGWEANAFLNLLPVGLASAIPS